MPGGTFAIKDQGMTVFTVATAALLPVYVWRIQDVFPILATLQVPSLVSVFALAVFLFGGHVGTAIPRMRTRALQAAAFMVVWMVVSVPTSVYPGLSFSFIVSDHIKTFLMMLMVLASIRNAFDAERLLLTNIVGALIYCINILTSYSVGRDGRLNVELYYDANDISMMVVCTVPVAVYFLRSQAKAYQRIIALGASGIFVLTIIQTGSRGGFLGLVAVGGFLLFGFRAIPVRTRFTSLAILGVMMLVLAGPQFWELMGTMLHPQDDYNLDSEEGRIQVWTRGMGYVASRPIAGVGVNAYRVAEGTISELAPRQAEGSGVRWGTAHNSFVQIAAELGIPGVVAFVIFLNAMFTAGWKLARADPEGAISTRERALAEALVGSLIGYVVAGSFLSQAYSAYLYATCGVLMGLVAASGGGSATNGRTRSAVRPSPPRVRVSQHHPQIPR